MTKLNSSKQFLFSDIVISGFTIYLLIAQGYITYVAYFTCSFVAVVLRFYSSGSE